MAACLCELVLGVRVSKAVVLVMLYAALYFAACLTGKPVGDAILYFGCRKQAEDYIYEEELKSYQQDGTLTKVSTSRTAHSQK